MSISYIHEYQHDSVIIRCGILMPRWKYRSGDHSNQVKRMFPDMLGGYILNEHATYLLSNEKFMEDF